MIGMNEDAGFWLEIPVLKIIHAKVQLAWSLTFCVHFDPFNFPSMLSLAWVVK